MKHFEHLSAYLEYVNLPRAEHPQLSVLRFSKELMKVFRESSPPVTNNCYTISFKKVLSGGINYGQTKYDFSNGAMAFVAPRQVAEWTSHTELSQKGFLITFHEDFIRGTTLAKKIKDYGFFSYAIHEALHFSPKEEQIILSLFNTIEAEYKNNQDQFSKNIIISQLETLLQYSNRFYNRQFINRKEVTSILLDRFKQELRKFYEQNAINGIPSIETIAKKLLVSQRYLTDALKKKTGKSAKEHINLFIVERAKDKLIGTSESISEIAYSLGFDYPQHFSKVFKKITKSSPTEYRNIN